MSRVREQYRVTFDSAMDNCFHVHKDDGKTLVFELHEYDTVFLSFICDVEDVVVVLAVVLFSWLSVQVHCAGRAFHICWMDLGLV